MATPTYTAISTITLTSTDSEIVFSSIPATYRDLIVVASGRSSAAGAADNLGCYFNGTASNCSTVRMYGTGSTTGSNVSPNNTRISQITIPAASAAYFGVVTIQIMDYSATDKHKSVLVRSNTAGDQVHAAAGRWASNDAITSVTLDLYATSANFAIGSTFSLYGISA